MKRPLSRPSSTLLRRKLVHGILLCPLLAYSQGQLASPAAAKEAPTGQTIAQSLSVGQQAFTRGDLTTAITAWTAARSAAHTQGDDKQELHLLVLLSQAQIASGQWDLGAEELQDAQVLANRSKDAADLALVKSNLGTLYSQTNQASLADRYLNDALTLAQQTNDKAATASILNSLGSLRVAQGRNSEGTQNYSQSLALAKEAGDNSLAARVAINLATLDVQQDKDASASLTAAEAAVAPTVDAEKVELLTSLGADYVALAGRDGMTDDSKAQQLGQAERLYKAANQEAERLNNARLKSLTMGSLGEVDEKRGQNEAALASTRQARFFAQQANADYLSYRWEWQMGRLLKNQGQLDDAIAAYRRSITTFRTLCHCGGTPVFSGYEETVRPLYYQLADLLMQRSGTAQNATQAQAMLVEARDTVELLKTAELSDYLGDDCVSTGLAKTKDISTYLDKAAAIYIIPLPDRTEILVGLSSGLQRVTVPVTSTVLLARARRLRLQLQRPASDQYLSYSKDLYNWLIRPLQPILQQNKVETLVFVLDGSLRTIPMAALNDGTSFLVQQYKLAEAPSLTLTDPRPLQNQEIRVFAGGVSQAVQGYDALKSVPEELNSIKSSYPVTTLLNQNFTRSNLDNKIETGDYSVVHIASHGEFGSQAASTYLLTYDGKVTLNQLEDLIRPHEFRGTPVELLVLSACQTAAGDDRAALGLAGVAVKAGARSAVASLWSVSDEATAALVKNFYAELKQHPEASKAAALQQAQLDLMKDERFQHPSFWAPYLLIGNWM